MAIEFERNDARVQRQKSRWCSDVIETSIKPSGRHAVGQRKVWGTGSAKKNCAVPKIAKFHSGGRRGTLWRFRTKLWLALLWVICNYIFWIIGKKAFPSSPDNYLGGDPFAEISACVFVFCPSLLCKSRLRNDLLCVGWDVKPYSLAGFSFMPTTYPVQFLAKQRASVVNFTIFALSPRAFPTRWRWQLDRATN